MLSKMVIAQACGCKLNKLWKLIFVLLMLSLTTHSMRYELNYFDPTLSTAWHGSKSVIVTAVHTDTAVAAINDIGGSVSTELWLIDAVAAQLTFSQIQTLQQQPGLVSIIEDKRVETAVAPQLTNIQTDGESDDDSATNRDDWASDRRRFVASHYIGDKIEVSPILLPNGNIFVISKHGDSQILSSDGHTLHQFTVANGDEKFKTPLVAGLDSAVFAASEDKVVYAINSNGTIRWIYEVDHKIKGGIAIDHDAGHLIVLDEKGKLTAISIATGANLWEFEYEGKKPGKAESPPLISEDGTIYAVLEKGHVIALNSSGQLLWTYIVDKGKEFKYAPILSPDGTLFVLNKKEDLIALNSDGSERFYFEPDKKITAAPIVSSIGILILPASDKVYAINPDGSILFEFESPKSGKFKTSPLFSPNESQIYIALKEERLFALDATNGQVLWQHETEDKIEAAPIVESNGDIHLVSKDGRYLILSPEGDILYSRLMLGELKMSPIMGLDGKFTFIVTEAYTVEAVSLLEDTWNGSRFATPTSDPAIWDFSSVASLDIGADVLHDPLLQDGSAIIGNGVTVAVVDSGVHFSQDILDVSKSHIESIYLGQADFVSDGLCPSGIDGDKESGYCWTNYEHSYDPYGHGTHISGIIWNNFTDEDTEVMMGIAPSADILSVRVLDDKGMGSYADIIEGIQFVIDNKESFNVGVMNLSLSGISTVPYFVDPLNRAVEFAWDAGIVVVAAAGNSGDGAQTISVPGNDPYIITVGAIHANQTPGYWGDDLIPSWSASGPTHDSFIKPDILAPGTDIVSFMDSDSTGMPAAYLATEFPEFIESTSLFRMHGTSTATAVTSGVIALMLEANPNLTPDEVKFRLMSTARTAVTEETEPVYSVFRQGMGRIWVPNAVLGSFENQNANIGLNIKDDLNHPWEEGDSPDSAHNPDLAHHFQGPIQIKISDDETAVMYFVPELNDGTPIILGIADLATQSWLSPDTLNSRALTFDDGILWSQNTVWSGGTYAWGGGTYAWGGGTYAWGGGTYAWGGGTYAWGGGTYAWGGGTYAWGGGTPWDELIYSNFTGVESALLNIKELD